MYSRETVEEMNKLSLEVFGTKSKWKKMVELGVPELVEEDTKRLVVKDGKEEYETIKTPKMHVGGGGGEVHQHALKRYSVSEAKEFMLMVKDRREQVQQAIRRLEEQRKAENDLKQAVAEAASGSSI